MRPHAKQSASGASPAAEPSAVAQAPVAGATGMGVGSPCH